MEDMVRFAWSILRESGALTAITVFLASIIMLRVFRNVVLGYMGKITRMTKTELDNLLVNVLAEIPNSVYLLFALYISVQFVPVPNIVDNILRYAMTFVVVFYVIRLAHRVIDRFRDEFIAKRLAEDVKEDVSIIRLLASLLKYSLWLVGFLLVLANMEVDITALIAGLGVGGIAVALAAQNVIEDIFSSFSIFFDKPYKLGDFILIGEDRGEVQKIGIKTTRIKTLRGEELVVSNKEMTAARIHNFGRMPHRRIDFKFGVTYDTPVEKLRKIPKMVREVIESQKLIRFDRVHFKEFGDFSLNFEVVYYLDSPEYNRYMDTQQAINLAIKEAFEREGIQFAYPTQTLYLVREGYGGK